MFIRLSFLDEKSRCNLSVILNRQDRFEEVPVAFPISPISPMSPICVLIYCGYHEALQDVDGGSCGNVAGKT